MEGERALSFTLLQYRRNVSTYVQEVVEESDIHILQPIVRYMNSFRVANYRRSYRAEVLFRASREQQALKQLRNSKIKALDLFYDEVLTFKEHNTPQSFLLLQYSVTPKSVIYTVIRRNKTICPHLCKDVFAYIREGYSRPIRATILDWSSSRRHLLIKLHKLMRILHFLVPVRHLKYTSCMRRLEVYKKVAKKLSDQLNKCLVRQKAFPASGKKAIDRLFLTMKRESSTRQLRPKFLKF